MPTKKSDFFDSRDSYLSFVSSTNEKSRIAFQLSSYLDKSTIQSNAFHIFDAGIGEGTIISTLLCAVHKKFPEDPIMVVGKEISIDDINNLLSFLGDRFFEHKNLIFCITNISYKNLNIQSLKNVKFLKKELIGNTSFEFAKQLMNMTPTIRKYWELEEQSKNALKPKHQSMLIIYRKDQKISLNHLIPQSLKELPKNFDFIIASQPFRLRSPYERTMNLLLAPLIYMLDKKGQLFLIYSSGNDFTKKLLKKFLPKINPYKYNDPDIFITMVKKLFGRSIKTSKSHFFFSFINMSLTTKKQFSPMNAFGLWNAVNYVGQISEKEKQLVQLNMKNLNLISSFAKKMNLRFKNVIIRFEKK